MNLYFITIFVMCVLNIGIALAKHGEPRKDKYNFFITLIGSLLDLWLIVKAIHTGL